MADFGAISRNLQEGKAQEVHDMVTKALEEGVSARDILEKGLMDGMSIVGEQFKKNEIFVPEVLIAARAMKFGTDLLRPYFLSGNIKSIGKGVIGTVKGDIHDIGKNLVKMMMEGKGFEMIDLGADVSPQQFVDAAIQHNANIICCSAMLTTTMMNMDEVVKLAEKQGIRDKITIMIGGAPVTEAYKDSIGADIYTPDAASAADAAIGVLEVAS